jgi:hypothetical protein
MGEMFSVQVKESQVRTKPSFLGSVVATVHYGDRLTSLTTQDSWVEVVLSGSKKGWMHLSALTDKEIVLGAGGQGANQGASSSELALAGKGFNKQVEEQFRQKNSQANFAGVDKMEKYLVSQKEMEQFVQAGELKPEGGAV